MNIEYLRTTSLRAVGSVRSTSRKPADLLYRNHQRIPRRKPLDIIYYVMLYALSALLSVLRHPYSALCLPTSVMRLLSSVFIREQPPDILFRRFADSSFGNKTGYQFCRCDIKSKIGCLTGLRANQNAG